MPLPKAHPWYLSGDPDVQTLLDETADILVRSRVLLRISRSTLTRTNRDNALQWKEIAELRRVLSLPR